ncbi:hypothetical protein BU15DRAFT_37425, partial [Melanogaster broomeanus]
GESDYTSLRDRARQEGDLKAQCSQQSQEAYDRGDHAQAKVLSEDAKYHARKKDILNDKASAIIFKGKTIYTPGEVDLHGLFVKEAISYSEKAIKKAQLRGDSQIRFIVGQGTHSEGGVPKLKPAIEKEMRKRRLSVEEDPRNRGVLIVTLGS